MGLPPAGEHPFAGSDQFPAQGNIDWNLPQRRFGERIQRVHARSRNAHTVARPQQEDSLVRMSARNPVEGGCGHLAAEHIARVRDDDGLRGGGAVAGGVQPGCQQGLDFFRGSGVERPGDGGLSHFLGFRIAGHRYGVQGRGERDGKEDKDDMTAAGPHTTGRQDRTFKVNHSAGIVKVGEVPFFIRKKGVYLCD